MLTGSWHLPLLGLAQMLTDFSNHPLESRPVKNGEAFASTVWSHFLFQLRYKVPQMSPHLEDITKTTGPISSSSNEI